MSDFTDKKGLFQFNYQLLAAALHPKLAPLFLKYSNYLNVDSEKSKKFKKLAEKAEIIEEDVMMNRLRAHEFSEDDISMIIRTYSAVKNDEEVIKIAYEKMTNIIYKNACETVGMTKFVEQIRSGELRIPTYSGDLNQDFFRYTSLNDPRNKDDEERLPVFKSHYNTINEHITGQQGYLSNSLIMVAGGPSFGKSILLMAEAIEALKQGKSVLYAAIGDIDTFDFKSRMSSMILKRRPNEIFIDINKCVEEANKIVPILDENKFRQEIIAPAYMDIDEWIDVNTDLGAFDKFDVIIVDYDTNFKNMEGQSGTYEKQGYVYDRLKSIAMLGKVIMVGSQTKIGVWNEQIAGLDSASESTRKQQIVDMAITLSWDKGGNTYMSGNHIGYINIAKNRRGTTTAFPTFLDITGEFKEISRDLYEELKNTTKPCTLESSLSGFSYELAGVKKQTEVSLDTISEKEIKDETN